MTDAKLLKIWNASPHWHTAYLAIGLPREEIRRRLRVLRDRGLQVKTMRCGFNCMTRKQRNAIARKGGTAVSRNRAHMANIGAVGGHNSHQGNCRSKKSRK